jgi:hypothetical protein
LAHPYNNLGRRVMAAFMSYHLGISLDYTFKTYVADEVNDQWCEMCRGIYAQMVANDAKQVLGDSGAHGDYEPDI